MVVDDDEDIRALLEVYLAGAGCRVMLAGGREEALRLLQEERPDLILLDMQLGEIGGDEMAGVLRRAGHTGPLAMMSAANDPATRARAERAGGRAFLSKPLNRSELLGQIGALLDRKDAERGS
jgi:DNA-binding response OmpR family regulator